MKNKGFTLIEVLATIVIIGLLSSVAIIGVSRYRKQVDEKEKITLHSTIKSAFENYRIKNNVKKNQNIDIKELNFDLGKGTIKYGGKTCNITNGNISFILNGDYKDKIKVETEEEKQKAYIKYNICALDGATKKCKTPFEPSGQETTCIKLSCDGVVVIDDYSNENSLCSK